MTFEDCCKLDPAINALHLQVKSFAKEHRHDKAFCANRHWVQTFKPQLLPLVGCERRRGPAELQSSLAYDVVYDAIYELLPDCRNCCCG